MSNLNMTQTTGGMGMENYSFKDGKVYDAIMDIMQELKVERKGEERDKDGKLLYTFIKIGDLRAALQPLLLKNRCIIRKGKSTHIRERRQNKWGNWVNIDVIETPFIILSMTDGSYVTGYGRGEGSDWGSSSVTLANADAFKDFIGTTFCLVTDDEVTEEMQEKRVNPDEKESKEPAKPVQAETEEKPEKKPTKPKKTQASSSVGGKMVEKMIEHQKAVETQKAIQPDANFVASVPVPTNDVVKHIEKTVNPSDGEALELPEQAVADKVKEQNFVPTTEMEEVTEPAESEEPQETVEEQPEVSEPAETEPEEPVENVEPDEDTVDLDERLKALAGIICPVPNRFVQGMTFEELCEKALLNTTDEEKTAKSCIIFCSKNANMENKFPEFAEACRLAVQKFNFEM